MINRRELKKTTLLLHLSKQAQTAFKQRPWCPILLCAVRWPWADTPQSMSCSYRCQGSRVPRREDEWQLEKAPVWVKVCCARQGPMARCQAKNLPWLFSGPPLLQEAPRGAAWSYGNHVTLAHKSGLHRLRAVTFPDERDYEARNLTFYWPSSY